jgi:FAD/FMN-containing dehydrogenase
MSSTLFGICGEDNVVLRGDSRYAEWSKSYNLDKHVVAQPAAVVRPKLAHEVADVVKFAVEKGYKVQAKSGGHSYANFCESGACSYTLALSVSESVRSRRTRNHQHRRRRSCRTQEV